ncbi:phosphoserine phosphatase SerB [Oecophyllibacter saccharovorans]|uniref:Phosphoserine phosphatase n=1 Tax=Oecophyllibacter saccharovorans TaxID=2558360 RepID=A0A506UL09_9PROT|nr:phosphoserine phosphatase SerB [Oecophyllibacter saccharovorans]QDH15171.1 phosphoserine phosphatase SerB [Oecophyllibacter saccharovorans]TPW33732.1 phosphoserine phosphatase SerB [Oecophyllibacter saccharovorans]TPW34008.1 phosphoserine phosphatase SerB [Oecophyllibacter saccharovorans]
MSLPSVLTLVANRRDNTLSKEAIDIARNLVKGEEPQILSEGEAVDIPCLTPAEGDATLNTIRATLAPYRVDPILTKTRGRRKAVLIADMDSTTVDGETLDELAQLSGTGAECARITQLAMNGEMDFDESIRARTALLAGQPVSELEDVFKHLKLSQDITELVRTMNANGAVTALISGGFTWFTSRIAKIVGFQQNYANVLEIRDGVITGKLLGPILGPEQKKLHLIRLCEERGVKLSASITTGDGANDVPMLLAAGLGLAYHAKPRVREQVEGQVNFCGMRAHLFAQGYKADQITNE